MPLINFRSSTLEDNSIISMADALLDDTASPRPTVPLRQSQQIDNLPRLSPDTEWAQDTASIVNAAGETSRGRMSHSASFNSDEQPPPIPRRVSSTNSILLTPTFQNPTTSRGEIIP